MVHLVTGFAQAGRTSSAQVALVRGAASHALFDALPHYDYRRIKSHLLDTAAGLVLVALLCRRRRRAGFPLRPALWGAVGALLPDVDSFLNLLGVTSKENKLFPFHRAPFPHGKAGPILDSLLKAVILLAAWRVAFSSELADRRSACEDPCGILRYRRYRSPRTDLGNPESFP